MNPVILELPDEILLKVIKEPALDIKDALALSMVCHRFSNICQSEDMWKAKFIKQWPWIWKKISNKQDKIQSWKQEIMSVMKLKGKLNKILKSLSHELYKYKNVTTPIMSSIMKLFSIGSFGLFYAQDLIRDIHLQSSHGSDALLQEKNRPINERQGRPVLVRNRPPIPLVGQRPNWIRVLPSQQGRPIQLSNYENLTLQYYALLVNQHIHRIICEQEWKEFFEIPSELQTLEKGAFYFAKWFQAVEFLYTDLDKFTSQLDDICVQVLRYLRENFPNHRAVSHSLIHPDTPLTDHLWTRKECEQLYDCINHTFYSVNKFKSNYESFMLDHIFVNKVMEAKDGNSITISILYQSICHRLGLVLHPVNCHSHFMLKARMAGTEQIEYIDSLTDGKRRERRQFTSGHHPNVSSRDISICPTSRVLDRLANIAIHLEQASIQFTEIGQAAEISAIFNPRNEQILEFLYSLNISFELNLDRIINGCSEMMEITPQWSEKFRLLKRQAEALLVEQNKGPKPLVTKQRPASDKVKFATGMVMHHKFYNYTCVIFGWDERCVKSMDWILDMNVHTLQYKQHQPFYDVLVGDGSHRYAAQENLLLTEAVLVNHREVGKYFDQFNSKYYVANEQLMAEYPDEKRVLDKFFPSRE